MSNSPFDDADDDTARNNIKHNGEKSNDTLSPFDDKFNFEPDSDLNLRDTKPNKEIEEDEHSIIPTPGIGSTNMFEDIKLDDDDDDNYTPNTTTTQQWNKEPKRLRYGTRRKSKKNQFDAHRKKTLKWARKNIHNPFEDHDTTTQQQLDETGIQNRSHEVRSVYHNLPLPDELLDEDGIPIMEYPRNKIRTTKYTPLTFFPKNIYLQFNNFANIYFLILLILGAFQIFGVTNPGLAAVPLIVIVILTAIKDAIEDSRRTILDMEVNNTRTHILTGVENLNVPYDDVSLWRKFKKANTRLLIRFFQFLNERFTATGKETRRIRQLKRQGAKKFSRSMENAPRTSLDSFQSVRMSADYNRPSLDDPRVDNLLTNSNINGVIDHSLPKRTDCKFANDYWKNVKVGDIVRVHNNDEIPADIILLSTSDNDGGCYVETKNLDGESNLKVRQSLNCTSDIRSSRDIVRSRFWVESEGPHANLYTYQGNLKWIDSSDQSMHNEPIGINNLLLRGCTLRNTKWAMGMVIFTGNDTKTMLNSGITPTKKSRISRELNFSVLLNFVLLFFLCLIAGIVNGVYYKKSPRSRDFFEFGTVAGSPALNGFVSFWVAVILYQSLVPISLYISVEIIKTAQAIFIYLDVTLYNEKLDYPCTPKSWNISDDLGQIEYIFSDKTGTLTQNVMEFKKCTINGVSYGRAYTEALAGLRKRQGVDVDTEARIEKKSITRDREEMIDKLRVLSNNSQFYPDEVTFVSKEFVNDLQGNNGDVQMKCCQHFMLALALCHSVLVESNKTDPNKLELKAQSPDEAALVTTARDMGFSFVGKSKKGLLVEIQGTQKEFEILNVLEFNSSRKRMSCIVKIPGKNEMDEPKALLICKGADSVIYSRLARKHGFNDETVLEKTALHLEQYATEGLRTLCIAQREITWSEYEAWNAKYDIAAASLADREKELDDVANLIERDMILLGGTAIEDRLQDGVPDSIALLGEAGIKLWVLTGDKVETAINIGFSCNLLHSDMELLVIKTTGEDVLEYGKDPLEIVNNLILKYLDEKFAMEGSEKELQDAKNDHRPPQGEFAVIIDGDALKLALKGDEMKRRFLLLCKNCKAVLCCRVSPSQKAAVVKLVKDTLDVMTLAIGDGSNDVAMIQSADIGVGIAGEEGRQAVMCSDFAIGQFRYVTKLVLVHGKWCYKRIAEMIPQFFYKNVIFTLALFWYGVHNDFDGSYLFEYTYLMFYNLAFTSLPVIFLGIFDQDVNETISMVVPQLYRSGILRKEWNQYKFLWYMFDGVYQSVICYFFPYLIYYKTDIVTSNGLGLDHRYYVGIIVTGIAVTSCNFYLLMEQYRWDWFTTFFASLSTIVYFGWTGIWTSSIASYEFWKGASRMYGSPSFWAVYFVGFLFCIFPRFTFDCFRKYLYPTDVDVIREMWKRGDFNEYPDRYDPTDPQRVKITNPWNSRNQISDTFLDGSIVGGSNTSEGTVITEEIPMSFLDINKGDDVDKKTSSSRQLTKESPGSFESLTNSDSGNAISGGVNRDSVHLRRSMGSRLKTSLERTRDEMLSSNELDTRFSVDRARVSLDLPALTHAEALIKARQDKP
ncbi:aminophospholipid-translocating P4-type ATPase DNF2 NDAI_0J01530 [Naumovozyma dairenensis CBS 421]|uniref:Phospholipid-transporting ATPase n=1 Tax=Naumovozyma dairenensis (strain ATCC 10597 / BCRC 20456 / CBS 421 / NBRC 0211 / NRRL Y-12639) TaxID=1071378 RepID=G0WGW7_NAUDC|nr:hypothetical protein NDAI_0J01530 [Naumovozyma dairenensis CBS 421]CCD27045.1 hypothetical protein NDAI_0J01530 [Naumovozyma dairenensis CBS 421]